MLQDFIGRDDWLKKFEDHCRQAETPEIWRIKGVMGVGKSTLLQAFRQQCIEKEQLHCFLDLENLPLTRGIEILDTLIQSANGSNIQSANGSKNGKLSKSLGNIKQQSNELAQRFDGEIKLASKIGEFADALTGNAFTAGAKALKEGYGYSKDKLTAENPQPAQSAEMEALQQLSELGEHHPILLIDTFEHILPAHAKLVTRLMATRFGCVWV